MLGLVWWQIFQTHHKCGYVTFKVTWIYKSFEIAISEQMRLFK